MLYDEPQTHVLLGVEFEYQFDDGRFILDGFEDSCVAVSVPVGGPSETLAFQRPRLHRFLDLGAPSFRDAGHSENVKCVLKRRREIFVIADYFRPVVLKKYERSSNRFQIAANVGGVWNYNQEVGP